MRDPGLADCELRSVRRHVPKELLLAALIVLSLLALTETAVAGPREQARRMHDRIVGVPPSIRRATWERAYYRLFNT